MPAHIDWEGMANHLGYSSITEMFEKEMGKGRDARYLKHNSTTFALKLGVSDVSLRKKMKDLGVSRPMRGRQFPFFPERFGFKTEKEMFENFVFKQKLDPKEIQNLLKTKISEHPVRMQTVCIRLKKNDCFPYKRRKRSYV